MSREVKFRQIISSKKCVLPGPLLGLFVSIYIYCVNKMRDVLERGWWNMVVAVVVVVTQSGFCRRFCHLWLYILLQIFMCV